MKKQAIVREQTYVYIMATLSDDMEVVMPCKVGISKCPPVRRKQVQRERARPIVLLASFKMPCRYEALNVERKFHEVCDEWRVEGEWFEIEPHNAVAIMKENLDAYVRDLLQPENTYQLYTVNEYIGIPGFSYLNGLEFAYGQ